MDLEKIKYEQTSFKSTDNYTRNLDSLPDLARSCLFQYLHLVDIINLMLASKYFYGSYKIEELSIIDNDSYNYKNNWPLTSKSTKLKDHIGLSNLGLLSNPKINLFDLRYLRIRTFKDYHPLFTLELINKFTKLQNLDLNYIKTTSSCNILQLPNLRTLSIQLELNELDKLVIDTPNLYNLIMASRYDKIELKYPLSVKYLKSGYEEGIFKFINLECLELDSFDDLDSDDLLKFNKLKKIKFYKDRLNDLSILKELFRLKKNDLEMVLNGVKIKEIIKLEEFEEFDAFEDHRLKFQLMNYGELEDNLHFEYEMDYNELLSFLPNNRITTLFEKYTNIQIIKIFEEIQDEDQLINFIKRCNILYELRIYGSLVSQEFYNRLPMISLLTKLFTSGININFKFIEMMPYLVELECRDILENENINLNKLKYLKIIHFKIDNYRININKEAVINKYIVDINGKRVDLPGKRYSSLNELFELINDLRDKIKKGDIQFLM